MDNEKIQLFHDGGPYHIETSPLVCSANQCTGFCIIGTSVMKELSHLKNLRAKIHMIRELLIPNNVHVAKYAFEKPKELLKIFGVNNAIFQKQKYTSTENVFYRFF